MHGYRPSPRPDDRAPTPTSDAPPYRCLATAIKRALLHDLAENRPMLATVHPDAAMALHWFQGQRPDLAPKIVAELAEEAERKFGVPFEIVCDSLGMTWPLSDDTA